MFANFARKACIPMRTHLIAMRVQGVTPEYIRELRAAGFNPDQEQFIATQSAGRRCRVRSRHERSWHSTRRNQLVGLKVQGVTPEYVRETSRRWAHRDRRPGHRVESAGRHSGLPAGNARAGP